MNPGELHIFIDPFSAPSYLAIKPTRTLCTEIGVRAVWHPFRAPPERRPSADADADVRSRHQRVRQSYRDHDCARYAAWQGLPFHRPEPPAERDLVDYALLLAGRDGDAGGFIESLTARIWGGSPPPSDAQLLAAMPGRTDFGASFAREGAAALAAEARSVEPLGIFDAPAYLIDGELFIGRQHLPAIRECLLHGNPFLTDPRSR